MPNFLLQHRRILAVLCGGFFGTLARYLLSDFIQTWLGNGWPYDILFINITGAFFLAFFTTLADATFLIGPTRRLFLNVGFLGAYTTFSSLSLGAGLLLGSHRWLLGLLYLFLSLLVGLLAVLFGDQLAQSLIHWKRRPSPRSNITRKLTPHQLLYVEEEMNNAQDAYMQKDHLLPAEMTEQ